MPSEGGSMHYQHCHAWPSNQFLTIMRALFVIQAGLLLFVLGWFAVSKIRG
jgi:hypothetical protein